MDVISDDPGRTDLVEHEIETENASPIRLSPYRLPHATHEYLREEVKSLLTMRIIMPSKSPWATPVELVSKKDGSKRLCVDYRKLNIITCADPYPIPRVEDLIDDIGRTKYITALDLTKGYWQVPVAKSSQDKTAFITPWGEIPVPDHAIWTSSCSLDISAVDGHDSRRNTLVCCSLPGRRDNPQQYLGRTPGSPARGISEIEGCWSDYQGREMLVCV